MADVDITIYYNQERLNAMRRVLASQGKELEKAIYDQVDALYESVVPAQKRAVLDEKIERGMRSVRRNLRQLVDLRLCICTMNMRTTTWSLKCTPAFSRVREYTVTQPGPPKIKALGLRS